jgi:DNA invertase Pin-like site-specific DNA recombinase
LQHLAQLIGEFEAHGTALVATSQGIDTSESNPAGRLQMHVLASVAEFERSVIRERINAGLAAAREHGTILGRPRTPRRSHCAKACSTFASSNRLCIMSSNKFRNLKSCEN